MYAWEQELSRRRAQLPLVSEGNGTSVRVEACEVLQGRDGGPRFVYNLSGYNSRSSFYMQYVEEEQLRQLAQLAEVLVPRPREPTTVVKVELFQVSERPRRRRRKELAAAAPAGEGDTETAIIKRRMLEGR